MVTPCAMTEPTLPRPPRRSNADYRWSRTKIVAFLQALPATLSVAAAARSVGMSRQSAYRLRARLGPGFGTVWDDGLALGLTPRRAANARGGRSAGMTAPAPAPSVPQGDASPQGDAGAQGEAPLPQGDAPPAQGDALNAAGVTLAAQRVA